MTPTHSLTITTSSVTSSSTTSTSGLLRKPLVSNGASPPGSSDTAGLVRPPLHVDGGTGGVGGQPPAQRYDNGLVSDHICAPVEISR